MSHKEFSTPSKIYNISYSLTPIFIYLYVFVFEWGIYGIPLARTTAEVIGTITILYVLKKDLK